MQAEAIYWMCGAIVAVGASAVFFKVHKEFRKRAGFEPPDIVYEKDYFGQPQPDKVLWRTPPLRINDGDTEFFNGCLFILKYGLVAASVFFAATAIIKAMALH